MCSISISRAQCGQQHTARAIPPHFTEPPRGPDAEQSKFHRSILSRSYRGGTPITIAHRGDLFARQNFPHLREKLS